MIDKNRAVRFSEITVMLLCAAFAAQAAATKSLVSVPAPVTPAADNTKVLVVSGYCSPVTVQNLTTATLFTSIPAFTGCAEVPLIISPGLTNFPAGSVYVAYPDDGTASTVIAAVPASGGPVSPLGNVAGRFDHVGLLLDTSGLYGGGLLVFTETAQVYRFSTGLASNAPTLVGTISGIPSPHLELPVIAPQGFGPQGGQVWVVNEQEAGAGDNKIYAVSPSLTAVAILDTNAVLGGGDRTEGVAFPACNIPTPSFVASTVNLLDAYFGSNQVAFYSAPVGFGYVNREFGGTIYQITVSGSSYSLVLPAYDSGLPQQEHMYSAVCLSTSSCTLTLGGYRNHFSSKVTNLPTGGLFLGGTFYTSAELLQILDVTGNGGNGLIILAQQLITAMLNQFYGANPTTAQAQAIADANALIATIQPSGTKVIPPIGSGFLSPSQTGPIVTVLDQFNNSNECQ